MTLTMAPLSLNEHPVIEVARHVQGLKPYQVVSSLDHIQAHPEQTPYKIDWNESTVLPSPKVAEAITAFLQGSHHLNWYPVLNSANLIERLSRFYAIPEEKILVSSGSDDALNTLCATYINAGDLVLVASPTYQHFVLFAQARGARIVPFYASDPFTKDVAALRAQIQREQPRMVYIVSPNNPTGVMYTPDEMASLIDVAPNTLFILDEAYGEFARASCLELLGDYRNLVITRTFSKAYGIAGLRVGYAFADGTIVSDMRRIASPKGVNVMAQIGAIAALEDQEHLNWYVDQVERSKQVIADWAEVHGVPCHLTPANFVMMQFEQAPWVVRQLRNAGVYVRDRSAMTNLAGYVRFSVGTLEQTEIVLQHLENVLTSLAQPSA